MFGSVNPLLQLSSEIFFLSHPHGPGEDHGQGGGHLGPVGGRGAENHGKVALFSV